MLSQVLVWFWLRLQLPPAARVFERTQTAAYCLHLLAKSVTMCTMLGSVRIHVLAKLMSGYDCEYVERALHALRSAERGLES